MSKAKKPVAVEAVAEVVETAETEVVETEVVETEVVETALSEETPESFSDKIIKSGFKKVRTAQFRGSYQDTFFNDDCEAVISEQTLAVWKSEFPNAVIEEI